MGRIAFRPLCRPNPQLRMWSLVCLAFVMTGHAFTPPSEPSVPHSPVLHKRQDISTSTSAFAWWPYPSWGSWGLTIAVSPAPAPSAEIPPPKAVVASTTATTTTPSSSSTVPSTTSSSTSSSDPTPSFIRITALPPANTASSVTLARARAVEAAKSSKRFNIAYLAPLFAVVGAIAGGILTWLLYRYLPIFNRKRSRDSTLMSGPPYTPPSRHRFRRETPTSAAQLMAADEDADTTITPTTGRALRAAHFKRGNSKGNWFARARSAHNHPPSTPMEMTARTTQSTTEDDPFLPPRNSSAGNPAHTHREATDANMSRQHTADPYDALSDSEDDTPYETVRHKSIRRAILERIRLGTMRRPQYELGKVNEDDVETGVAESSASTQPGVQHRRGHKRSDSDAQLNAAADATPTSSRHPTICRNRSEAVTSPPGFRIVVEDPESGALFDSDGEAIVHVQPSPSPSPRRQRQHSDKFTPIPVRRSPDERRNPPYSTPSKPDLGRQYSATSASSSYSTPPSVPKPVHARPGINRIHSAVLPASPPLVTSPPLESQLFFGPSPSLRLNLPNVITSPPTKAPQYPRKNKNGLTDASPGAKELKEPNKLRTNRPPPLLPFPSHDGSSSPVRARLKKSPTKNPHPYTALPPPAERSDSSGSGTCAAPDTPTTSGSEKFGRGTTPAERYHARQTALGKVDEILSRSWSERSAGVESPNNFGAFLPPELGADFDKEMRGGLPGGGRSIEDALQGMGIEQRLEALRQR